MISPNWYNEWQEQLHLKFKSTYEQYYGGNNTAGMSFTTGPTFSSWSDMNDWNNYVNMRQSGQLNIKCPHCGARMDNEK